MDFASVRKKIFAAEAQGLTELDLSRKNLKILPPEIGRLTALKELDLGRNRLKTLPPEIGRLRALTALHLAGNRFKDLPPQIGRLTALTALGLGRNRLEVLPPEIGRLTALSALDLGDNRLEFLPHDVKLLSSLTWLGLAGNRLKALPPEIGRLTALAVLGLRRNDLTTLPPDIGQLTALTALDLGDNRLETLPPEIGRLTALKALDLTRNRLTDLPPEIGRLPEMATVPTWGNPLVNPPTQIAARGPRAMRDWFRLKDLPSNSWVARSSLASVWLCRRSRLALGETVAMTFLSVGAVASGYDTYLWFWLAFAPFLLLRTQESIADGLALYKWLVRSLKIRRSRQVLPVLALRLMLLGVGSVLVKVLVTARHVLSARSWRAVPQNFTLMTQHIDMLSPVELVPGAEAEFAVDQSNVFVVGDLRRNFTIDPAISGVLGSEYGEHGRKLSAFGHTAERVAGVVSLSIFFLFAWTYRFSVKATAVAYFPFLLFYRFEDDADEGETKRRNYACRQAKELSLSKWPALTAAGALAAFASLVLARINDIDWLETLVGELIENPNITSMAAMSAGHADKAFFTLLLALSIFHIFGRFGLLGLKHALSAWPEAEWQSALEVGAARIWYRIASTLWVATNVVATMLCIIAFALAVPFAWNHAGEIWAFLF